jgi:hypothetical protein
MIGTGDPFGYRLRQKSSDSLGSLDSLESDDQEETVAEALLQQENCLTSTIDNLIDTSAKIAVSTKINAEVGSTFHAWTTECPNPNFLPVSLLAGR